MLKLKEKQKLVVDLINSGAYHTIVLIGAVGTGKTDIAAHIMISIAYQFPKSYLTVFRQNLSTAKRTVIPSYLNMLDMMGLEDGEDYIYNRQDFTINFINNGSTIAFIEADITKDRQARKIKGINATASHIDEADELNQVMFTQALSRNGRRNENGQPSFSIITMNPNNTYLKNMYYVPYKNGELPKGVAVVEFTIDDSWQSEVDIEAMKQNPKSWVERYINNNWDYEDDQDSLFKYRYLDGSITREIDSSASRYIGYDVARTGTDRSVASLWWGKTLVDIKIIKNRDEVKTTDEQAMELIKYSVQNGVLMKNVSVDGVGVGVGVIDYMKSRGMNVYEFISGARPTSEKYDNLRSQVIFEFSQGLEKGEIKIYEGCPFRNELISEAMLHQYKITGKVLIVESKDKVKERTGGSSPDIFDAVIMGIAPQIIITPQNNISRIVF